jgi:hypothetical protein
MTLQGLFGLLNRLVVAIANQWDCLGDMAIGSDGVGAILDHQISN